MTHYALAVLIYFISTPTGYGQTTITLEATADATICADGTPSCSNNNYGLPNGAAINETILAGANQHDWLDGDGQIFQGLIKFDLSSIPAGATILSADLKLRVRQRSGSTPRSVEILPVTGTWNESSVTWSNRPNLGSAVLSYSHRECFTCSFDITSLVSDWISDPSTNYGIALFGPSAFTNKDFNVGYYSRHTSSAGDRPRLVITVATSTGDLALTVQNVNGTSVPLPADNAEAILSKSGSQLANRATNSSGVALFQDLDPGSDYGVEVYHTPTNPSTPFGLEYWGRRDSNLCYRQHDQYTYISPKYTLRHRVAGLPGRHE